MRPSGSWWGMFSVLYLNRVNGSPRTYGGAYDDQGMVLDAIDVPVSFRGPYEVLRKLEPHELEGLIQSVCSRAALELEKGVLMALIAKEKGESK